MPEKERPLPKPPAQAHGRKKTFENDEDNPLMADQIAMAAAEGRLEQFIKDELPDNEQTRKLVSMMMGMTGMGPADSMMGEKTGPYTPPEEGSFPEKEAPFIPSEPPEDILRAAGKADVKGLNDLLKREHLKRSPDLISADADKANTEAGNPLPASEKEVMDRMLRIASENSLTPDWIILRALKLYIDGYDRTGRL